MLVVTHEIPLRYAINAADGSDDLDAPGPPAAERDALPLRPGSARPCRGGHRAPRLRRRVAMLFRAGATLPRRRLRQQTSSRPASKPRLRSA